MAKSFNCSSIGISCIWFATAETEEELLKKVLNHAAEEHGIKDMNEVQLESIKKSIKDI